MIIEFTTHLKTELPSAAKTSNFITCSKITLLEPLDQQLASLLTAENLTGTLSVPSFYALSYFRGKPLGGKSDGNTNKAV